LSRLQEKLEKLYGLRLHAARTLKGTDSTPNDIRTDYLTLLTRLGNPHLSIPPAIHVAGTNGKGSTVAFLKGILEAEGYKVHVFTSPHLIRFNERIVIAGSEITNDNLENLIDEVMEKTSDLEVTFFEIATAIAFLAFTRTKADISLIEVGMGGRKDCTNVIQNPLATIITRISRDHCQFLGNTIQEIAREKAGIIKPGAPCIIGYQETQLQGDSETLPFEQIAGQNDAPLHRAEHEWRISKIESDPSHFMFQYGSLLKTLPVPSLVGAHQLENAGAALACIHVIDSLSIHDKSLSQGLTRATWAGRLQRLINHPLQAFIPENADIWLDGGHNDSAGQVLARQAQEWHDTDARPLHVVMAIKSDKEADQFAAPLLPHLESLTIIPLPGMAEQSHDPAKLSQAIREKSPHLRVTTASDLEDALTGLAIQIPVNGIPIRVLLTGSLFLAGAVLGYKDVSDFKPSTARI